MNLFSPFENLGIRNRSVMAPVTRYSCEYNGLPTKAVGEYYIKRAKHDTGLIIVESCAVNGREARGYRNGASFFSQSHVDAWTPIVEEVHAAGAKIWIQLFHAGRLTVKEIAGSTPLAPSGIRPSDYPSYWRPKVNEVITNFQTGTSYEVPVEITPAAIESVISDFRNAAALAEKAGFDGVEIHGAHGYLIHTFLSSLSNKRLDRYGLNNGYLFLDELVRSCRAELRSSTTLSFRCSVHMVDNPIIRHSDEELDFKKIIPLLEANGIDVFHSSEIDSRKPLFGAKESLHQLIRSATSKPIVVCGAIQSLNDANKLLDEDDNTLIAFGRNFISNPDLISLFKDGRENEMVKFEYSKHIDKLF